MPSRAEILPLLPGLRRFAAALACADDSAGQREADEAVLRAVHMALREPPLWPGQDLRGLLYATLLRVQQGRPGLLSRPSEGPGLAPGLRALPFGHRAALLLVTLEGFSYDEAAETLGLSRNMLLGRLTTARQMLSRQLDAKGAHGARHAPYLRLVK